MNKTKLIIPSIVILAGTVFGSSYLSNTNSQKCDIKGNISAEKINHLPSCTSYNKTEIDESKGEKWFCSEKETENAGWRKAKNCE